MPGCGGEIFGTEPYLEYCPAPFLRRSIFSQLVAVDRNRLWDVNAVVVSLGEPQDGNRHAERMQRSCEERPQSLPSPD